MSLVLGYKDAPRCLPCLARAVSRDPDTLGAEICAYILTKECLHVGWKWAQLREPQCPRQIRTPAPPQADPPAAPEAPSPDATWNAGDTGCGELLLELRTRMLSLHPMQVLKITALDPGAPEDLPAWCRLTGHRLVLARHPDYWIQRKEE
ncbi:MAG: sulfurtransferase TusA family protein [Planctomycetes bacterium]|nr:sulfurtransferase TusA family protein [Planctomycetota bacterium]